MPMIKIWNDNWEENGKLYRVHGYNKPANSTGMHFELEDTDGNFITKVIPYHDIEWIDD